MEDQEPFADVIVSEDGFSLPDLKWRELLFIGAMRAEGEDFVRDVSRPMPPFERKGLFPEGGRLKARIDGKRVHLKRL